MSTEPPIPLELTSRLEQLEAQLGRRVHVRLVRLDDPELRGRIVEKGGAIEIECNDFNPGFFWHLDVLRTLLDRAERGEVPCELRDVG